MQINDSIFLGSALPEMLDDTLVIQQNKRLLFLSLLRNLIEIIVRGTSPLSLPDAIADSLSYVKAFGGTEQRNIPQPYTQVNYVTNTAQTAVDTGIMIDFAKNYEFEVECRAVSGSWYILQSRASASGNVTGIHGETSGSTIKLVVGNVTVCTSAITRTVGNKLYVKATLNAGTATLYVKDETANTEDTQTGSYGTTQPNPTAAVYLLGNAGAQYVDVNSDIYMARIKENDAVVMDYVPARQVATAGFYDTVSGTFKTALTPANLSADGNTVPTPDAPMDIVSNNGVLKARHQSGLPLGYTLLDYIESSGTQYIDTGVKVTQNNRVEVRYCYHTESSIGTSGRITGGRYTSGSPRNAFSMGTQNGKADPTTNMFSQFGTNGTAYAGPRVVIGDWFTEKTSTEGYYVNDTAYQTSIPTDDFETPYTVKLFAFEQSAPDGDPTIGCGVGRCANFKIYTNNVLTTNLVPAKNSEGTIGMYDLVSGQFFTNAGTGDFVAGNTVSDPVEIYTDGTVETIEDTIGNTATAEMLLAFDTTRIDEQEVISGVITRKVGIIVFDGTENWVKASNYTDIFYTDAATDAYYNSESAERIPVICTHLQGTDAINTNMTDNTIKLTAQGSALTTPLLYVKASVSGNDLTTWKNWLAAQYAAGTPVIVIYPLATPTTESVAGQTLQVQAGDNTLEITQASLAGLELEAKYKKGV